MEKDLAKFEINLKKFVTWRDAETELPMCSFATLYRVIGINDFVKKYYEEHPDVKFTPIENLFVHPDTLMDIKHFIERVWKTHDISIDGDNHVFWDLTSKYGRKAHYEKKLKALARNAVNMDYVDYSPAPDPEVDKNVIVIRIEEK